MTSPFKRGYVTAIVESRREEKMKKWIGFLTILVLFLVAPSFAFACHPDRHFGILVAIDVEAKRFSIFHLGDHPEMGGKFFTFSAEEPLLKELKLGAKVAVQFVTQQDQLIAKEIIL